MPEAFFFDSYAIIEMIESNPSYIQYKDVHVITTWLNLFEVYYYYCLRTGREDIADEILEEYFESCVDTTVHVTKEAALFKFENKKRRVSMADCVGYILAQKHNVKFLTGDKEFEDLPNVEFVK